jgi:hypothetical protein
VKSWLNRAQPLALAAALAVFFGACDEQLDGGASCPILCPQVPASVRDTTFFAVDFDTSIAAFPALGSETRLFVASLGDTLETRAIVRYDSLPKVFRRLNSVDDSAIVAVDSAYIRLTIVTGDTLGAPTTIEAYDVDMDGAEEADPTLVTTVFTPDRLLGSQTIAAADLKDSARVYIDGARLLEKIQRDEPQNRLRIGIRVSPAGAARLSILPTNGNGNPLLVFRPSTDTAVPKLTVFPLSKTPSEPQLAADLADYLVVADPPPEPGTDILRVGGLPGRRAYLRFAIPASILDSSNVVRATLLLTQVPSQGAPEPADSIAIQHFRVVASSAITDLRRAMNFIQRIRALDTMRLVAADTGERSFEIIDLVRAWRATTPEKTPRALVLRSTTEGEHARQIDFFSLEAPIAVRPRLRITFIPRREEQIP